MHMLLLVPRLMYRIPFHSFAHPICIQLSFFYQVVCTCKRILLTLLCSMYTISLSSPEPFYSPQVKAIYTVNVCKVPLPCSVASIQSSSAFDISDICLLKG